MTEHMLTSVGNPSNLEVQTKSLQQLFTLDE